MHSRSHGSAQRRRRRSSYVLLYSVNESFLISYFSSKKIISRNIHILPWSSPVLIVDLRSNIFCWLIYVVMDLTEAYIYVRSWPSDFEKWSRPASQLMEKWDFFLVAGKKYHNLNWILCVKTSP